MRGSKNKQLSMLTPMTLDGRVPKRHPLRRIKKMADEVLQELSPTFDAMYAKSGRRSIPPELLLKSKTDPDAKLTRKGNGQAAVLGYMGNALMENRDGLLVDVLVNEANGFAEGNAAPPPRPSHGAKRPPPPFGQGHGQGHGAGP